MIQRLKYVYEKQLLISRSVSTCASTRGGGLLKVKDFVRSVALMAWAKDTGCPWEARTCAHVARGGHLEVLQWARARDPQCPWDATTCAAAAGAGHLAVVRWARKHGCGWDDSTCRFAARHGHLAVLQWMRQQDPPCPWDTETICPDAAL